MAKRLAFAVYDGYDIRNAIEAISMGCGAVLDIAELIDTFGLETALALVKMYKRGHTDACKQLAVNFGVEGER